MTFKLSKQSHRNIVAFIIKLMNKVREYHSIGLALLPIVSCFSE